MITHICREGFGYLGKVRKFQQPQNRVKQHTVISRKLRNSKKILRIKFNFKKFINHETQHLCSVKRPISQKKVIFEVSGKIICFVMRSNTLKYWYNVVFLFHCFLVITVYKSYISEKSLISKYKISCHMVLFVNNNKSRAGRPN